MILIRVIGDNYFIDEVTFDSRFERENDDLLSNRDAFNCRCALFVVEDTVVVAYFVAASGDV
jgi:hypothetical protein